MDALWLFCRDASRLPTAWTPSFSSDGWVPAVLPLMDCCFAIHAVLKRRAVLQCRAVLQRRAASVLLCLCNLFCCTAGLCWGTLLLRVALVPPAWRGSSAVLPNLCARTYVPLLLYCCAADSVPLLLYRCFCTAPPAWRGTSRSWTSVPRCS